MSGPRVAYQGMPGAFGELAAIRFCGDETIPLPCRRFADVFSALSSRHADYAAVPCVNSLAGPVRESCRLLAREPIRVLDETGLPVSFALIGPPGVGLSRVRYVLSHPVALRQCTGLFRRYPDWRELEAFDTAGAVAEVVASGRNDCAAIAHARSAELYGAKRLLDNVQDGSENVTIFVLIARAETNNQRTSGRIGDLLANVSDRCSVVHRT
ncbi:MAG: prephenate dehydratase domain-containing protein [Gammaproteobacteria bacterium]